MALIVEQHSLPKVTIYTKTAFNKDTTFHHTIIDILYNLHRGDSMKYTIYGNKQSDTIIMAIPALGERAEFYDALANRLNHIKWIVCDLPEHNGYDTKDISIDSYIKNVKHLVDSLEITKVHLVGASIGATIVQAFYQKYPQTKSRPRNEKILESAFSLFIGPCFIYVQVGPGYVKYVLG